MSLSTALLASFITCETARTIYAYHAFHVSSSITPPLILLISEILKLVVATTFVCRSENGFKGLMKAGSPRRANILRSGIPAALFLVNTLVFYTVLPIVSPTLLTICILAKLPITAILYHVAVRKQRNVYAWTSLFWLCVGIVVFNIRTSNTNGKEDVKSTNWFVAPVAGLVIACLGSAASVYIEILTKAGDFWDSQFWLYTWGVILAVLSYPVSAFLYAMTKRNEPRVEVPFDIYVFPATALIIITGGTGLVVAVILRKKDNLLKLVGTSATLITTAAAQFLLLPSLREGKIGFCSMFGGGLVIVMTYCYNFYQNQPWPNDKRYRSIPQWDRSVETGCLTDEETGIELLNRLSIGSSRSTLRELDLKALSDTNGLPEPALFDDEGHVKQTEEPLNVHTEAKAYPEADNRAVQEDLEPKALDTTTYFDPNATKITCLLLIVTFLAIQTL